MSEHKTIGGYSARTFNKMARAIRDDGHPKAAYDLYKFISEQFITSPEDDDFLGPQNEANLAECAEAIGNIKAASQHYQAAYNLAPDRPELAVRYATSLSFKQKKYLEALDIIDKALMNDPHKDIRTALLGVKGISLLGLRDFDAAYDVYKELITPELKSEVSKPNSFYHCFGLSLTQKGLYTEALECFDNLDDQFDSYADSLSFMGFCANILGDSAKAENFYQQAMMTNNKWKTDINGHLFICSTSFYSQKHQEALVHCDYLLARESPQSAFYAEILRLKSTHLREMGDLDLATDIVSEILPRAFANPVKYRSVFVTVAKLQLQQGHFEDAVAHMELFIDGCSHRPNDKKWLNLALVSMQGMSTSAGQGGYPYLSHACKENAQLLQTAIDTQSKFPVLKPLTLE